MDNFQAELRKRIKLLGKSVNFTNKFKTLQNNEERIIFTFNLMKELNVTPTVKEVPKNSKYSEELREKGNKLFVTGSLDGHTCIKILKLYTKSISFAPSNSKELPLAYANRSAILLTIHHYKECIQDIDRALSLNYPDKLRAKLYVRKVECSILNGEFSIEENYKTALHWVEQMPLDDPNQKKLKIKLQNLKIQSNNMTKSNSKKEQKCLPTIIRSSMEVPCASDAIGIKYNDDYGRHVVALRDISPGEILGIEKPYTLTLHIDNLHTHCSNCLQVCWANIPCDNCTYAMYCSEKCKMEEWTKYHDIECSIFASLADASSYHLLDLNSTRLAIQAVKEFNDFKDLKRELEEVDKCSDLRTKGFSSDNKFYSNKYRSVYSLATNVDKRGPAHLFTISVDASFIVYLLATRTAMFGNKQEADLSALVNNRDVMFIGGLILRHQQIIPTNMHTFSETCGLNNRQRGSALLPFCSLINHSCDSNIIRNSRSDCVVLHTTYPIKKGEQLLDNYGQHYAMTPKQERQQKLLKQYYFECNCVPCREDWPLYFNLPSYKVTVKNQQDRSIITSALKKFNRYVILATKGDVLETLPIIQDLPKMIQVLYDYALMPCKEMNSVIETFKHVLCLHGNRFDIPTI